MSRLELTAGDHVVELGAGTGIFTRELVRLGLRVTAVEPVPAMRSRLAGSVGADVRAGTAEETGLPAGVADAVVAATAWHWFDAPHALREVARLLRPGSGGLGLVWNSYDETVPWVAEFAEIADRRRPADTPSERSGVWRHFFDSLEGWSQLEAEHLPNPWSTSPAGVVDRMLSSSAIAALTDQEREQVQREVWTVLTDHRLVACTTMVLPYTTSIYWTHPT